MTSTRKSASPPYVSSVETHRMTDFPQLVDRVSIPAIPYTVSARKLLDGAATFGSTIRISRVASKAAMVNFYHLAICPLYGG